MTVYYTVAEDAYLRQKHPDVDSDLVLCDDGIYRTSDEKRAWDHAEAIGGAMQLPSLKGLGQ